MRTFLIALMMTLLMPVATMAQSTEGTATEEAETEAPQESGSSIEDQLSLGEEVNAEPQAGQPYIKEKEGDWELRCIRAEEGDDPCQMYQLMTDSEGTPVAEMSIFRLPDGGRAVAGATVIVPLETSLPQQVTVRVDAGQARRYPFAFCTAIGCYSRIGLVQEEVNAFRRGNQATVTIVPALAPDQKVDLTLSLSGFTAAFEKTSQIDN